GDNGVANGYRCYGIIYSQKDFGFVVISNLQSGANDLVIRDLKKMMQDMPVSPPVPPSFKINQLPAERLADYVGDYDFGRYKNKIVLDGSQLILGDYKIFPVGKDRFFRFADFATLTFTRNADGTVNEMEWEGHFGKILGKRKL